MSKLKMRKSDEKLFQDSEKPHAHLQTILKTPVKFQKDQTKTVGGVKGTKYLLKTRDHAPRATPHGKPKTVSLHFSSKRRGTITTFPLYPCLLQGQQALPTISVGRPSDKSYRTPSPHPTTPLRHLRYLQDAPTTLPLRPRISD